jgi:pimeloyl-ACP methyl ester carboxylesterase
MAFSATEITGRAMPELMRGNVRLHYEVDGSGPPAVYCCGLGSHSNDMLGIALRGVLSEHYTLLTVDNRGSGQTVTPAGTSTTMEDMADDVAAVMDHIGMANANVLGISMGGCVAMLLALRHPQKTRRLVVAVSLAHTEAQGRADFMLRTGHEMRQRGVPLDLLNRFNAVFLLGESAFEHQWLVDAWVSAPPDPLQQSDEGWQLQTDALESYDIRAQLKNITIPTLVMSSTEDLLVPPRLQDEIAALIPGATIKRYPGGHVFMLLPMYSAQFAADVLDFWKGNL